MEFNHVPTSHGLLSLRNEDATSDCRFPLVGHADIIESEMTDISMMWKYWGKDPFYAIHSCPQKTSQGMSVEIN